MSENEKNLRELLSKSRESSQGVFGWRALIFVPQNITWRFLVAVSVFIVCQGIVTEAFYEVESSSFNYLEFAMDMVYAFDFTFALMHYVMKNTRKLKYGKKRPIFYLILDCIAIVSPERIYQGALVTIGDSERKIFNALHLMTMVRLYQIPMSFSVIKNSVSNAKLYPLISLLEVIFYYVLITHFLSCFIYLYFDERQKRSCHAEFLTCMFENVTVTFYLLCQYFVPPFSGYPLHDYKILLIVDLFVGYLFMYSYTIPMAIYRAFGTIYRDFEYSKMLLKVKILAKNRLSNPPLEKNILKYYHYVMTFGRGESQQQLLKLFPLSMQKRICCDMYWEAMRHSMLLKGLSMGCKRSLAIHMTAEFLLPNTILFEKDKNPTFFLYIESGLLEVMSMENEKMPLLNLVSGTVIGEYSFFLQKKSLATVRSANFTVIHTLKFRDLFRVLSDYPSDRKKLFQTVKKRLEFAKSIHKLKREVFALEPSIDTIKLGNIKWIKVQSRAILDLKKAEELMNMNPDNKILEDDYKQRIRNLNTKIEHTSLLLPQLCITSERTNKEGVVCLRMNFPWLMNPDCNFLSLWKKLIFTISFLVMCIYPAFIGWIPITPNWFFNVTVLVSAAFTIDVILRFLTAVKTKNVLKKTYYALITHNLTDFFLYLDIFAAIPFQIGTRHCKERFCSNIRYANALVKFYIVFSVMYRWNYQSKRGVFVRTILKNLFFMLFLIYCSAVVFNLTAVECIFYECDEKNWYQDLIKKVKVIDGDSASVIKSAHLGFKVSTEVSGEESFRSFSILLCLFLILLFYTLYMRGVCTATNALDLSSHTEYQMFVSFVYDFMKLYGLVGKVRDRVLSTMRFQWHYEGGIKVSEKQEIWDLLPLNLKNELDYSLKLPLLAKSKLFQWEDEEFLKDLCEKTVWLTVPLNTLLLTFGTQARYLYIIRKGFVQINSFMLKDLFLNVSKRIPATVGDTFPVIDALSQIPAAVNAVAVTACELLRLDLENVLSVMTIHDVFKDYFESVQKTDLSALTSTKLALSRYDYLSRNYEENKNKWSLTGIKCLDSLLGVLLQKEAISPTGICYLYWEVVRVFYIVFSLIVWPIVLGLCIKWRNQSIFIKVLFGLDIFFCIDFFIRGRVAYYNRIGIYITHTTKTFTHYMKTSFIADFIAFGPNFHIMYAIHKDNFDFHWSVFIIHIILRTFSFYRVVGITFHLCRFRTILHLKQLAIVVFFVFLLFHYYACFMVSLYMRGLCEPTFRLVNYKPVITEPCGYYFNELGFVAAVLLSVSFEQTNFGPLAAVIHIVLGIMKIITEISLYSCSTLICITTKKDLFSFRYRKKSLVEFLKRNRVQENLYNKTVDYFGYKWFRQNGIKLCRVFSTLPQSLQEDITLLLYKDTFKGVASLSNANEYFYRILARSVKEDHYKEDCLVIFQEEVQSYIYFIHKGQCYVDSLSKTLHKGSIFGDIKWNGLMSNNVFTRTEVTLLKIPSKVFYEALNDFYTTKRAFQAELTENEDYISSTYITNEEINTESGPLEGENEESEFILLSEEESLSVVSKKEKKKETDLSETKLLKIIKFGFLIVACGTVIVIPNFIVIRLFCWELLTIVYLMDVLWLIKIIITWRMTNFSIEADDKVSKRKKKFFLVCKITYDLLPVLPIEGIIFLFFEFWSSDHHCYIMSFFYLNRLLRIFYVFSYFRNKKRDASFLNWSLVLTELIKCALLFIFSCIIIFSCRYYYNQKKCRFFLSKNEKEEILQVYLCVVNFRVGSRVTGCANSSFGQVSISILSAVLSLCSKVHFVSTVFTMIFEMSYSKMTKMNKLQNLHSYLSVRGVSPFLLEWSRKYSYTLLNSFYEGSEPTLLKSSPTYLKIELLEELYMPYLLGCSLFQNLDKNFLRQLALRLHSNLFFPGDNIVEEGDVDHNMYCIQYGEVYVIEKHKQYTALEIATDVIVKGNAFGVMQGILSAFPHAKTYRAKTLTSILMLNFYDWEDLRLAFPSIKETIFKRCMEGMR